MGMTTSERVEQLEVLTRQQVTVSIGQEHRLIQVFANAWRAAHEREWPTARRLEAAGAFVRYFFTGRPTLLFAFGLGSLLALHASFMLSDQNQKLDLENYLNVVNSELGEAQRNSQLSQLLAPLIEELQLASRSAIDRPEGLEKSRTYRDIVPLDLNVAARIAVLTQTFQPYRWIQNDTGAGVLLKPEGEGWFYNFMTWVRSLYDAGFGKSAMANRLAESKIPVLTSERRSPERGLLLVNMYALGFDFSPLTRFNSTFEHAYARGARLDGIDLGGLVGAGPGKSTPFDLGLADLTGATFEGAFLQGVGFVLANLTLANFTAANAQNTNFRGANLDQANFNFTFLEGADLRDSYIGDVMFSNADLTGANLSRVKGFEDASIGNACLVRESTLMPESWDWEGYTIPVGCCGADKQDMHQNFNLDDNGACSATDSAKKNRRRWD